VQSSLEGCDRWGEGRGILYFEASVVQWKDIRPWRPEYRPEGKHFVSGQFFIFGDAAKLRWAGGGARSALFGGAMSSKRRVRAAHGRARAAKTH
jgi:hypothetical protein